MKSQQDQILDALKAGEILTPLESLNRFGTFRLGARINDLKKLGHNIINLEKSGKFARYKLIPPQAPTLPYPFKEKPVEANQQLL